jgi:hypothetical protein
MLVLLFLDSYRKSLLESPLVAVVCQYPHCSMILRLLIQVQNLLPSIDEDVKPNNYFSTKST